MKTGIAKLPNSIYLKCIFSVYVFYSIEFTMSIFIASLVFDSSYFKLNTYEKLGILLGSTVSAVLGYSLLNVFLPKKQKTLKSQEGKALSI